jgi:hypothetical protein
MDQGLHSGGVGFRSLRMLIRFYVLGLNGSVSVDGKQEREMVKSC